MQKGIKYYGQALAIACEIGAKEIRSEFLLSLGTAHYALGNLADACRCYEEALTLNISSTNYHCAIKL
jgi:tetratricopeptide (TPR) repeat protein